MRMLLTCLLIAAPQMTFAFCGGWNSPVAPGFDSSSWADKWPVLATILVAVALFSTFVVRRVIALRDMPEEGI